MVKIIFFDFFSARNVVKIEKSVKIKHKSFFWGALKSKIINTLMAKIKVVHTWRKSSRKKLGRWSACYCPIFDGVSTVRCRAGPHALNYQHMVAIVIEVNSYFLCEKICFVICFHTKVKRVTKDINSQYRTYNFSKSDGKVPKIGLSFLFIEFGKI